MIILNDVSKFYDTRAGQAVILDNINLTILPGEKLGILGRNGAGKSTLIRLISGTERPSRGHVQRHMSVSWPLAFTGAFQSSLTGLDNLRFVCRVYGCSAEDKIEYVREFTELGKYLYEPVRTYSSGMRSRLAFALSMCIEFDCYLVDEIMAVGDARFQKKCQIELFDKRKDRAMIIVSHDAEYVRDHCDHAAVIVSGKVTNFGNTSDAYSYYHESIK
jgi:capsular polysaccharide transport system ATP-binding protein